MEDVNRYTLVCCYGGETKGLWFDRDIAESYRLSLDDWWLWTVVDIDNEL